MSTTALSSLAFASQHVVIYTGTFLFIAGIIGGPLVLLVFLSLNTFRQSSCVFYLTVMSFVNIFYLFPGLLTFIIVNGFSINWTDTSLFYCKFRSYYVQLCVLISFTCMCLATIDQFLATCSNPRWHRWNNIKFARYIITGTVIVWILVESPFILYDGHIVSNITGKPSCTFSNVIFQKYFTYFHLPALESIIPVIIMIIFGVLAYQNVRNIAYRTIPLLRRELDKQLTTMVLVQVFCDVLIVTPAVVESIFNFVIGILSNSVTAMQLNLSRNIIVIFYYFHFVVCINDINSHYRLKKSFFYIFVEFILHLCLCIKTISSTIGLCSVYNASESMASSKNNYQSNSPTNII